MRVVNNISVRVFCREVKDRELIVTKLKLLLPFDLEKEKVKIEERSAEGFEDRQIKIFSVELNRERHTNAFINNLIENLGEEKKTLLEQLESRLDNELNFFIRLDKEMLLKGRFVLTDSGNCYHIRINIASFPKSRANAVNAIKNILCCPV